MSDEAPRLVLPDHPWAERLGDMAWESARANLTDGPDGPVMASVPGLGRTWLWDTCMMALYAKYAPDLLPVTRSLDHFYRAMRSDGFVAMAYELDTGEASYGARINPPILSWAEWELYQITGDRARLDQVLGHLVSNHHWINQHRRRPSGLFWYEDSGSSGMDNAPRGGRPSAELNGGDLCHVDLIAQQAMNARYIGRIAEQLGRDEVVAWAEREHRDLSDLLEATHWSDRGQFYFDLFSQETLADRHNFVNHRTVAGFWPLLSHSASEEHAAALAAALADPEDFATPHRVPSLSVSDPNFDPDGGYWLGGVWSPTNYMVCRGLQAYGYTDLACEIAQEHVAALGAIADDARFGGLWECAAPMAAAPSTVYHGRLCRPNFVGWTGLSVTSLVIECLIGLELSAADASVIWRPLMQARQGVRNLRFMGGQVSVVGDLDSAGAFTVEVTTTSALTLTVQPAGADRAWTYACAPGTQVLTSRTEQSATMDR